MGLKHIPCILKIVGIAASAAIKLGEAFPEAVFCIHLPSDRQGEGLAELVRSSVRELSGVRKIAAAGGVTLDTVPLLKECGIEIGIVGSAITKSGNKRETAARFAGAVRM